MAFKYEFFRTLRYFIRENIIFYFFLVGFAIIIAFCEGLNITLLYPIISMGLGMEENYSPFPRIFTLLVDFLPFQSFFVGLIVIFLLLTIFLLVLQLSYWRLSYIFTKDITLSVKNEMYRSLFTCDYRLFEEKKQGELINLINNGPQTITWTFEMIMGLIADISLSIVVILSLFIISPGGLIVVIAGGMMYYVINNWISKKASNQLGKLNYASQQSENVIVNEYITGVRAISASNRVKHWEKKVNHTISRYWDQYPKLRFLQRLPGLLVYSLFLLSIGIVLLFFYLFYHESFQSLLPIIGTYTVGLLRILPKATGIGFNYQQLIQSTPYIHSVHRFLIETQYNNIKNGATSFSHLNSDIIFDNVTFSYQNFPVICNLTFTAKKGKTTAIVGPSGAGKSTITSLLLRLYDPIDGKILVNNINLQEFDLGSFRDHIGYVGQEPFVFNASIRENIIFGGEYSSEELEHAAILAHADEFIKKLPAGFDTIIGDRGLKLSGGEKQRLVIARAMIRKPEILILDEATAALDNISEGMVQSAIDEVSKESTTLVIAHRLTTVQKADTIYVIDNGKIIEEGSHDCLLLRKGLYWKMYTQTHNNV